MTITTAISSTIARPTMKIVVWPRSSRRAPAHPPPPVISTYCPIGTVCRDSSGEARAAAAEDLRQERHVDPRADHAR